MTILAEKMTAKFIRYFKRGIFKGRNILICSLLRLSLSRVVYKRVSGIFFLREKCG